MRFETPQTTPAVLNRRIQLRMLSFGGLIVICLFTLSILNRSTTPPEGGTRTASADTPAALDPQDTQPAFDSDRFVAMRLTDDNGVRGQWQETSNRERAREAAEDRDLFQRRGQQRPRDNGMFPRRPAAEAESSGFPDGDTLPPQSNPLVTDDFNDAKPPISRRRETDNATPRDDEGFDNLTDSGFNRSRPSDSLDETSRPSPSRGWSGDDDSLNKDPFDDLASKEDQSLPGSSFLPGSNTLPGSNVLPDNDQFPDRDLPTPTTPRPRRSSLPDDDFGFDQQPVRQPSPTRRRDPSDLPSDLDTGNDDLNRADPLRTNDDLPGLTNRRRPTNRRDVPPPDTDPLRDSPSSSDGVSGFGGMASVQIDKQYLDLVKDNTVGIRRDEAEVFYWLLDHARRVASSALESAGLTQVQYVNLMTEPDRFRGEPITIEGDLWALYEFNAGRNDYGIGRVYEGWVFTGDSGNHPFRVVFTSLPRGLQPGENLRRPVQVTGYFFKREGYQSRGGVDFAPLLLARRLQVNPLPNGLSFPAGMTPHAVGVFMAIGLALLVTMIGLSVSDERSSEERLQRFRHYPQLSFANVALPDFTSVEESLRQLAERERASAISGAYGPLLSRQTLHEHALRSDREFQQQISEEHHRHHQRPIDAVSSWATRQQKLKAEIDAMRTAPGQNYERTWPDRDELNSDLLAPARHVLPKVVQPPEPPPVPTTSYSFPVSTPVPPAPRVPIVHADVPPVTTNPHPVVSQLHSVVAVDPASIDYRASKLSEWEEEIARMNHRSQGIQTATEVPSFEESVVDQIEHDRQAREQDVQDRIHLQQMESQRINEAQVERERAEQERQSHRHDNLNHEPQYDDSDADEFSLSDDDVDRSYDHHSTGDSVDHHSNGNRPSQSNWGRNRKRRRNWRDGRSS